MIGLAGLRGGRTRDFRLFLLLPQLALALLATLGQGCSPLLLGLVPVFFMFVRWKG